ESDLGNERKSRRGRCAPFGKLRRRVGFETVERQTRGVDAFAHDDDDGDRLRGAGPWHLSLGMDIERGGRDRGHTEAYRSDSGLIGRIDRSAMLAGENGTDSWMQRPGHRHCGNRYGECPSRNTPAESDTILAPLKRGKHRDAH